MKIITDNAAYVQKNDIAYLNSTDIPIPASIYTKVYNSRIIVIDDTNRYEFVKYEEPKEIEFFREIDWIADYNDFKDLSRDEIIEIGIKVNEERNKLAEKFYNLSDEEKQKNMDMYERCDLLNYKIWSIRDIFLFKIGHLKFDLPIEIASKENGIKKLINILTKKDNN